MPLFPPLDFGNEERTSSRQTMNTDVLFARYRELQKYVGWTTEDDERIRECASCLAPALGQLVDDFYAQIAQHPNARRVITGGAEQIQRLKGKLRSWLEELLATPHGGDYVLRRWRVGWRHVEIGLDHIYALAALSRLRRGLTHALEQNWPGDSASLNATRRSLDLLLDLDMAVIQDAYQAEDLARQRRDEREATTRQLLENAPCLMVVLSPDASIHYFSPFAEELTGYRADEVLAQNYLELFVDDEATRRAIEENIGSILQGGKTRDFQNRIRCKDGSTLSMLWHAQRLSDFEGSEAVLAVGHDITQLERAREKTLQAERLAAIGQMVTGLAHESGNALARSQACLEMLALEVDDNDEAKELIARIQNAQDHLQRLYEEVRGYAAPLKLQCETWSLRSIWRQAWNNLAMRRQDRDATLFDAVEGINLELPLDSFRIEQVFRNIFENALAACPDPLEVRVGVSECTLAGQTAVRVRVRDNGPGLSVEQRQRIFEPFFTTKTKGTGLGMAIARRILVAHDGTLEVGNSEQGAEIILTIPRTRS